MRRRPHDDHSFMAKFVGTVILVAFLLILGSVFGIIPGCGVEKEVIREVEKPVEVEKPAEGCGESEDGDERPGQCAGGLVGSVTEICKDGQWLIQAVDCRPVEKPEPNCVDFQIVTQLNRDNGCLNSGCHSNYESKAVFDDNIEKVIFQTESGRMPLGGSPLSEDQVDIYRQYEATNRKADCQAQEPPPPPGGGGGYGYNQIRQEVLDQQLGLAQAQQGTTRFVSCHAYPGSKDECHRAVEKSVNLVSQVSNIIRLPFEDNIVAWDLTRTGHNVQDWGVIQNFVELQFTDNSQLGQQIRLIAGSGDDNPWLMAESFIDTMANEPTVYYFLDRAPDNFNDFLIQNGCDTVERNDNLLDAINSFDRIDVSVRGLRDSILTQQKPRTAWVIPCNEGRVWVTQDHANTADQNNVFLRPFPDFFVGELAQVIDNFDLFFDAGEAFAVKRNGLHSYYLFDATGARQNAAPTDIVRNPNDEFGNGEIFAAPGACAFCHYGGILDLTDEVKESVLGANFLNQDQIEVLKAIYNDKWDDWQRIDNANVEQALRRMDQFPRPELISEVRGYYLRDWTSEQFCAFVGVEFNECIQNIAQSAVLRARFSPLLAQGGRTSKDEVVQGFADIIQEFRLDRDALVGGN